ncbi:MAG: isochorismate synthase [Microcoleaceae cyanobacterium]
MNIFQSIENAVTYLSEAISRIFSPNDDMYPMIGINPFEGDAYQGTNWAD